MRAAPWGLPSARRAASHRDEVAAFIDRLQDAEFDRSAPVAAPTARQPAAGQALRDMPAEQLAAELQRRGWIVTKP